MSAAYYPLTATTEETCRAISEMTTRAMITTTITVGQSHWGAEVRAALAEPFIDVIAGEGGAGTVRGAVCAVHALPSQYLHEVPSDGSAYQAAGT